MKPVLMMVFGLTLLTGCINVVSRSYKKPVPSDFETVNCMEIGRQNLNAHQWQAIKEAASDVCVIFSDKEFKDQISSGNWLASCERKKGKPDSISGQEMYKLLMERKQRFSIYVHKLRDAEGETDNDENNPDNNIITIDPDLIEGWYSSHDSIKGGLVNVIAHEYVHLISDRFLDYDNDAPKGCGEDVLVSYRTGNLAEEIWLKRHRKYP